MKTNELIKVRRQELGLTMKELAMRTGVSEATVSRWESGDIKNMRRDRIAAIARALDLPPAVLMDWEEYDTEAMERKKAIKEINDLTSTAKLENLRIVLNLLKQLEGKE